MSLVLVDVDFIHQLGSCKGNNCIIARCWVAPAWFPPWWRQAYTIEVPIFYPATSMFVPYHTLDGWAASAHAWYVHPRLWDLKTSTSFATIFRISFQCNSEAHWMPLSKLRDWETPGQLRRSPSILCWFGVNGSCNWMSMSAKVMQLKSLCPCRVWFSIVCHSMACETPKDAILKFSSVCRNAMTTRTACFRRVPQNGLTRQGQKAMTSDAWKTKSHNSWRCFPTFRSRSGESVGDAFGRYP